MHISPSSNEISPQPFEDKMTTSTAAFWDKRAEGYAAQPIRNMPAYEDTLERVRRHLSPRGTALEIGCGTGTTALKLADAVQHYTATDYSNGMVAIGQRKAADQGVGNVTFRQAGALDPDLDGTFDAVLGFNLLHLIEDTEGAVRKAHDRLKPGGVFITKTPCLDGKAWHLRALIWVMRRLGLAPYVRGLAIPELEAMVTDAGFRIVETHTYPGMVNSRFITARKA